MFNDYRADFVSLSEKFVDYVANFAKYRVTGTYRAPLRELIAWITVCSRKSCGKITGGAPFLPE